MKLGRTLQHDFPTLPTVQDRARPASVRPDRIPDLPELPELSGARGSS